MYALTCAIPTLKASQCRLIVDEIDLYWAPIGMRRGMTVSAAGGILNRHWHNLSKKRKRFSSFSDITRLQNTRNTTYQDVLIRKTQIHIHNE